MERRQRTEGWREKEGREERGMERRQRTEGWEREGRKGGERDGEKAEDGGMGERRKGGRREGWREGGGRRDGREKEGREEKRDGEKAEDGGMGERRKEGREERRMERRQRTEGWEKRCGTGRRRDESRGDGERGMEAEAGTGGLKATAERRFPAAAAGGRGPGTLASQGRRRTPPAMPYGASLLLLLLLPWGSHCTTGADGPSPCPARREAPAEGMGQTCQRTCTQDRDCSGRRQCLCDGACGLSCVIPGRTCPWPVQIDNAKTHLAQASRGFGALMEVTCQPGFRMSKGQGAALSRCQGDRKWSLTASCERDLAPSSFCSPPPETDNGFHSGASYRAGGEVRYKCKRGYRLEGPETIRCQENQEWSGPAPTCHPVFCPPPGDIAEGYLVAVEKAQYRAGELVYYLCKRSYLLDGTNRVTCRGNGTWSPRPFCRARCVVPAQRSRVLYQGRKLWIQEIPEGQVQHGEIVTFYCRSQNQTQSCSYPAPSHCFDGLLPLPACYDEPTWLQYKLFPKRVVSEIRPC
ncbi:unnamed protein product [Caretta caretta]